MPTISIIMAAHDAASTLSTAVESVLKQTIGDWELFICDDASSDATRSIAGSFNDARIHVFHNQQNIGPGPTRDRLIEVARGQWIAALDADDAYAPERLEKLLTVAAANPGAIVFDEIMECHDTHGGLQSWRKMRRLGAYDGDAAAIRQITAANWISGQRLITFPLIPIRLIREHCITHPPIPSGEDVAFRLALLAKSKAPLWYVPEPLYFYRVRPGSLSSRPDSTRQLIEVLQNSISEFDWSPVTQEAIRFRIYLAERRETYLGFFNALMRKRIRAAARVVAAHPWVLREFAHRAIKILPYHVARLRHGGAWKRRF